MVRQEIIEKVRQLQHQPRRIRNISVIAHVDHGKSTLSDSLVCAAGLLSKDKAGDALVMDSMKEEKERGITIKSSGISLPFDIVLDCDEAIEPPAPSAASAAASSSPSATAADSKTASSDITVVADDASSSSSSPAAAVNAAATTASSDSSDSKTPSPSASGSKVESFLVNLIDSPGHVDFSPEVTAALRVTDGALVVVDCIEGVCVQTKTVLRQAIQERIKPVLFLNKMDRIFDLKMESEDAYQALVKTVESVNVVVGTYHDEALGDVSVWPQAGTVAFGSGLHGWGFTLRSFAKVWHEQFGLTVKEMTQKLWGDWFFDPKHKKFVTDQTTAGGRKLQRGFCLLVLDPLRQMQVALKEDDVATYTKMMKRFGLAMPVSKDKEELSGKKLMKAVMQSWMPASDAMLQMIVQHLPSPVKAQAYRVDKLYSGPLDDAAATAIRNCDNKGPLVMYVSKMVPNSDHSRFYAFGRIFAGSLHTGQVVRIQGPDYVPGDSKSSDLHVKPLQGVYVMMGPSVESVGSCVCGNIVGLMGVDQYLAKCGTITTFDHAHNFVSMKYSVAPIVRLAVEPANPAHLNKLIQGLKKLSKSDPLVQVSTSEDGEHIVAGCGELHLEVCFNMLKNDFMRDVPLKVSQPVVSYCESVETKASQIVCGKSPNKLNRVFMEGLPLGEELCKAIGDGVIREDMESKARAKLLCEEFKWDLGEARKIWCFGAPPNGQANIMVDATKGVQYLNEVKESICSSFKSLTNLGVMCGEPLRGLRVNITDAKIHPDAPHHGAGQMMPATRLAVYACQLASTPILLEPIYSCEVTVPQAAQQGVFQTLRQRRAQVLASEEVGVGNTSVVRAFLPVMESFGFTQSLRENTSGQAFPLLTFSHWERLPGDIEDPTSLAHKTVKDIRLRKSLAAALPQLNDFHCKM